LLNALKIFPTTGDAVTLSSEFNALFIPFAPAPSKARARNIRYLFPETETSQVIEKSASFPLAVIEVSVPNAVH